MAVGLPVRRIIEALEDGIEDEEVYEPEEGSEDEEEGAEDEVDGEEQDLAGVRIELLDALKEGSKWLVVDNVHICHWYKKYENETKWRCSGYHLFKCPFQLSTIEKDDGEVVLVKMSDLKSHICSQEIAGVILHKFRLKLRERMQGNLDDQWNKIWAEERTKLLESLKDQPELSNQVLLEMKDARSFRVGAQHARSKILPPYKRTTSQWTLKRLLARLLFHYLFLLIAFPKH